MRLFVIFNVYFLIKYAILVPETPKTIWTMAAALGCMSETEVKPLLLKTKQSEDTGLWSLELGLS